MTIIDEEIDKKRSEVSRQATMLSWLEINRDILSKLSETSSINAYGSHSIWINVYTREDVAIAMSTGSVWSKSTENNIMVYTIRVGQFAVNIRARDGALPKTCKVITESVTYPAQPARTETIEKIVCDV